MKKFCIAMMLFAASLTYGGTVTTYFSLMDISDDSSGLWASATGYVTTGSGYVEIELVNTSPRQDNFKDTGDSANPFITELEINLNGYSAIAASSYVRSTATTLYTSGAGVAATAMGPADLYYKLVAADTPGMNACLMYGEADNLRNDNAIGSLNVLDGSNVPVEDFATGFLNASPYTDSGLVINSAIFRFILDTTDTPDVGYWAADNLVIKFQGGGDYSMHVENIPEPATLALLALGGLPLLLRKR